MKIKFKPSDLKDFVKQHWLFISLYVAILVVGIIGIKLWINSEVERSINSIEYKTSDCDNPDGYCYIGDDSYTIVGYEQKEFPIRENEDSSLYKQRFGNTKYYFIAKSNPWGITQYKRYRRGEAIYAYTIEPTAVALRSMSSVSPAYEFRKLYDKIIEEYDVRIKPGMEILNISSSFHHYELDKESSFVPSDYWFDERSDKLFFARKGFAKYNLCEETDKVQACIIGGIAVFALIETLLFALIWTIRKKKKRIRILSLIKLNNPFVAKPSIPKNSLSDAEYEVLLHKINPINFMNPYDAEKVKIANDLYSALLKSRDNETIIRMIEEKAKTDLKI